MKRIYCTSDIEDLAAQGVRRLHIDPDVVITQLARERAEELGITLVENGQDVEPAAKTPQTSTARGMPPNERPLGCQHGPLPRVPRTQASPETIVEQLVDAVSRLRDQGG